MPLVEFGDWTPDLPAHLNSGVSSLMNAIPEARGYRSAADLLAFTDALTARAKGMYASIDEAKGDFNFAGDATKLYRLISNVWTDESQAGNYTVATDDYWDFARYGNVIIAAARYEDPQQFTVSPVSGTFTDLAASAPQGAHVAVIRDQVMLGNIFDSGDGDVPNRVHWGPIGNPTGDWTPALSTLAGRRDLGGDGGWVQAVVGGEFGLVFQETSVWRATFAGPPTKFQLDEIEKAQGTPAPRSVVKYRSRIYYLGQNGFYVTGGGGESTPIGRNKIDEFFLKDVQADQIHMTVGHGDPENQRIHWAYVGADASGDVPNRIIVYSVIDDKFGVVDIETQYLGDLRSGGTDMDTDLQALYPNLDLVPFSLDSAQWAAGRLQLSGFNGANQAGNFSGSALPATIETGQHQLIEGRRALMQNMRPIVDDAGTGSINLNVAGKTRTQNTTAYQSADTPVDAEGNCPILQASRYFRFRMKTTGTFEHAMGIDVDQAVDDGEY